MTKGPDAFRTISEAADEVGVPQHVLRFWETKFSFIRPLKRAGGRRFYRPQDVALLQGVRTLLYDKGYKIEGVQKLYREQGIKNLAAAAQPGFVPSVAGTRLPRAAETEAQPPADLADADTATRLRAVLTELEEAKAWLDAMIARDDA
ncbi:MerR family transcriptional regulator [Caulobacter sp. 17J65-9]|uniref:MerR family transcriptional regulator n=1 Tax=Caulobacter sp. 17J65-9 TaxID=2709382 RepID=UPI0013CC5E4E|nr:MerR family transcriptional regulator [Caulobacter sp. 17J65-9]